MIIALVFVFASFTLLVSTLTEAVSRFLGLRGEYLLRGIRTLLDKENNFTLPDFREVKAFLGRKPSQPEVDDTARIPDVMSHCLVATQADRGVMPKNAGNSRLSRRERRALPSYLSSRNFAGALIDVIVPDAQGR